MAAVKIQHKNCLQSTLRKKDNKHVICRSRSVCIGKNCALGLEYAGPRPAAYSRPLAQFFPIRTSRPANNIYILQKNGRYTELTLFMYEPEYPEVNESASLEMFINDLSAILTSTKIRRPYPSIKSFVH